MSKNKKETSEELMFKLRESLKCEILEEVKEREITMDEALKLIAKSDGKSVNDVLKETGHLNVRRSAQTGALKISELIKFMESSGDQLKIVLKDKRVLIIKIK